MENLLILGITFAIFVIGEVLYLLYHIYEKKKMQDMVFQAFEDGKTTRFSSDELAFIKKEAKRARKHFEIDDITWNDIAMDEVFMRMNYCLSSAGDQRLYGILRNPQVEEQAVQEKVTVIDLLSKSNDVQKLKSILFRIGGQCDTSIDALYRLPKEQIECNSLGAYALLILCFIFLCVGFFVPACFMGIFLIFNINYYYAEHTRRKHADSFICAMHLVRYARAIQTLSKCDCAKDLNSYFPIFETSKALEKVQTSLFDDIVSGDGFFLMLAKNVFLLEIILYQRLSKQLLAHRKDILQAVAILGELDSLLAVHTYKQQHPKCCDVSFVKDRTLHATQMLHPLVEHCIPNDVELRQNILISGSNASGKSTYLKMIAINAIFAQTFGFALADQYQGDMFQIYTSMALQDSLLAKDSYFVAEVRSIKRILDSLNQEHPVLCMIDEILRGTNTGERIASSSEILMCFVKQPALCLAATHDLELTHILEKHYQNMHFSEDFDQETMQFNYHIQTGPSNSRNAIKLLSALGFDAETIEEAKQRRVFYENSGTWMDEKEISYGA